MVSCNPLRYKPVYLYIEGRWVEIPKEDYIIQVSYYPPVCVLGFQTNSDDTWILGTLFMKSYYTIFDMEQRRIGLTPHHFSHAIMNPLDTTYPHDSPYRPPNSPTKLMDFFFETAIVLAVVALVVLVLRCFYYYGCYWWWNWWWYSSSYEAVPTNKAKASPDEIQLVVIKL